MKYKNIKKNTKVDTYLDNLFIAVSDMFWDMVDVGITDAEARMLINRNVKMIIDEGLRQDKENDIR